VLEDARGQRERPKLSPVLGTEVLLRQFINQRWMVTLGLVYWMYYSQLEVLIDAAVHSEHGKLIRCDIKQGSIGRSIDL
jgi:hypothetical protein